MPWSTEKMKKTNINFKRDLNLSELENFKKNSSGNIRVTSEITSEVADQIIKNIAEKKGISDTVAMALIAGLVQNGGTNKGAGNSAKFTLGEYTLTAQELGNFIKKLNEGGTVRQLARAMADEIADISIEMGFEGDLANQMRYDYPDITKDEAVWCSNFQTTNTKCPDRVRNWLVENYRKRFNR